MFNSLAKTIAVAALSKGKGLRKTREEIENPVRGYCSNSPREVAYLETIVADGFK